MAVGEIEVVLAIDIFQTSEPAMVPAAATAIDSHAVRRQSRIPCTTNLNNIVLPRSTQHHYQLSLPFQTKKVSLRITQGET